MIHPDTKLDFVSDLVGYGVFATQFIPKGTIVYVKDDLEIVISPEHVIHKDEKYKKVIDTYSYRDEYGNYILSWDIAKYVNRANIGARIANNIARTTIIPPPPSRRPPLPAPPQNIE